MSASRKMNKYVNKLNKEVSDARKMVNDSDSNDTDDSDDNSGKSKDREKEKEKIGGEKPTEDQVEKLEEKLEAAQGDQKSLFLIIFQVRSFRLI